MSSPTIDNLYELVKEQFYLINPSQLTECIDYIMRLISHMNELTGEEKKIIVINLVKRLIMEFAREDQKKMMLLMVDTFGSHLIDKLCLVAKKGIYKPKGICPCFS